MATITPPTQAPLRLTDEERDAVALALRSCRVHSVQDDRRLAALADRVQASRPSRRDTIYQMLSNAGEAGCVHADFRAAGIPLFGPHVESLRVEAGLACEMVSEYAPGGGLRMRVVLVKDEWA